MKNFAKHSVSRWSAGLAIAALTFSVAAHAAFKSVDKGEIDFRAVGPAGLKIDGEGTGIDVSEAGGKLNIKVDLTNFKTGISLRDDHLKKFLKTEVNKYAVMSVDKSSITIPESGKTSQGSATGTLALNGKSKPFKFDYKVDNKGGTYEVQGKGTVDFTHHGYEKPCYLGQCVDKDVQLKVKFKAKD